MLNLTADISSFYHLVDQKDGILSEIVVFDRIRTERVFYTVLQQIKDRLSIKYKYFTLAESLDFISSRPVEYFVNPDDEGCLKPVNRTVYENFKNGSKTAVNLTLMPLYYDMNLKNLAAEYLIIPVQRFSFMVFSDSLLPSFTIDNFKLLQVYLYTRLLDLKLYQKKHIIENMKNDIVNQLPGQLLSCRSGTPYYQIVLRLSDKKIAEKLYLAMYVEDILVEQNGYFVYLYLKQSFDTERLTVIIRQKLSLLGYSV